ncbi:MAG: type I-U CRISPR-associated RAMP protein Csb1/Cas7u [Desulforhabdus sp.]|jgi:CRISPR-associated protein Csb1|nr:type I-U CRISPR-associated RAMP protein Csb1/Cas7u [Desulforhabdus sp.]
MSLDLTPLDSASRLLVEARLTVASGTGGRFQPTGFPDLGPALYKGFMESAESQSNTTNELRMVDMLLIESVQSMANRLEEVCLLDEDYNADCQGIPYVRVLDGHRNNTFLTSSVREPHRLASPYVLGAKNSDGIFRDILKTALSANKQRPVHICKMVPEIFNRDPGCVLHGVFLEEIDGRIRLPRLVSGYIEACSPNQANSGGVYRGEVTAKDNIPYARQEFTSPCITASFILHLATLNSYKLDDDKRRFLQLWAMYKIDRFLRSHLRLRTACEFEVRDITPYLNGKPHKFSNDNGDGKAWPESETIQNDFFAIKNKCFPLQPGSDKWQRQRVEVLTYAVDIVIQEEISTNISANDFKLAGFEGRAEVKTVTRGKSKQKKTFDVLNLSGEWSKEDQRTLLEQNPERIETEDGDDRDNLAHSVVKNALTKWNDAWAKQQKKVAGSEENEE